MVGCGMWEVGRRDAGPGPCPQARGRVPTRLGHSGGSAPAGTDLLPLTCHSASLGMFRLRFYCCCCLRLEPCVGGSGGDGEEAGREERAAQRGLGRGAACGQLGNGAGGMALKIPLVLGAAWGGESRMLPQGKWEQHPGLGCKWE